MACDSLTEATSQLQMYLNRTVSRKTFLTQTYKQYGIQSVGVEHGEWPSPTVGDSSRGLEKLDSVSRRRPSQLPGEWTARYEAATDSLKQKIRSLMSWLDHWKAFVVAMAPALLVAANSAPGFSWPGSSLAVAWSNVEPQVKAKMRCGCPDSSTVPLALPKRSPRSVLACRGKATLTPWTGLMPVAI